MRTIKAITRMAPITTTAQSSEDGMAGDTAGICTTGAGRVTAGAGGTSIVITGAGGAGWTITGGCAKASATVNERASDHGLSTGAVTLTCQ